METTLPGAGSCGYGSFDPGLCTNPQENAHGYYAHCNQPLSGRVSDLPRVDLKYNKRAPAALFLRVAPPRCRLQRNSLAAANAAGMRPAP